VVEQHDRGAACCRHCCQGPLLCCDVHSVGAAHAPVPLAKSQAPSCHPPAPWQEAAATPGLLTRSPSLIRCDRREEESEA
jgi:hypothetical protein